jgi:hypothetical protein
MNNVFDIEWMIGAVIKRLTAQSNGVIVIETDKGAFWFSSKADPRGWLERAPDGRVPRNVKVSFDVTGKADVTGIYSA